MWAKLSRAVRNYLPGVSKVELIRLVYQAWEDFREKPHYCSTIVRSMPRRLHNIIEANGFPINY